MDLPTNLKDRLQSAQLVLFDGTLYDQNEMISRKEGIKTGSRMGHMSMSGPNGAISEFKNLNIARKVFIHINNTNPVLLKDSKERAIVEAAGWEIAHDGMEFNIE